jgi:hypothetical protein
MPTILGAAEAIHTAVEFRQFLVSRIKVKRKQ